MKYYLWTIGCQMNFADSRRAAEELLRLGYEAVDHPRDADLVLMNTCVVRQSAEDKVVGRLTSLAGLKRRRPELRIALIGCFVHDIPSIQHQYPWVDAFVLPSDVDAVVQLARDLAAGSPIGASRAPESPPVSVGVPISYGCDHLCTYCIVRIRRGREVSRPVDEIVAEVRELAARGVKEVTLLGQNVDSYGHDLPPPSPPLEGGGGSMPPSPPGRGVGGEGAPDLADLLEAVHGVEGVVRIRFLTSHPSDMTQRVIEAVAHLPKVCEQMELPVQAGDNKVLRRMGRPYTVEQYRDLVGRVRQAMPGVGLATDVIVGFPGETLEQFEATYRLLEEIRFDMVHVAAYSPRPGTPAERLADDVPQEEKERRRQAVDDLQERIVGEINATLLSQTVEILIEERHRAKWRGRTRTNKLVFVPIGKEDLAGRLVQVRIVQAGPWSMQGELVDDELENQGRGDWEKSGDAAEIG